jgi:hypothetical protein
MVRTDWVAWHARYDDPDSTLARRLVVVQARIAEALEAVPPGPIRVVSMCAGQGRDLIGALAGHPRRGDVRARLVEWEPRLVEAARVAVAEAGLGGIEVVRGDAALTDSYAGAVPADVVLACGVFGNIIDADVARTVAALPQLTAVGGTVVWTRHRREPDLVPAIDGWFAAAGFTRGWLSEPSARFGVGVHRSTEAPPPLRPGQRMFTFVDRPAPAGGHGAPTAYASEA